MGLGDELIRSCEEFWRKVFGQPDGSLPAGSAEQAGQAAEEQGNNTGVEETTQECIQCEIVTSAMLQPTFNLATTPELSEAAQEINLVIDEAGLGSELRLCHFIGQCRQETGGLILKSENLNYSASVLNSSFGVQNPAKSVGKLLK